MGNNKIGNGRYQEAGKVGSNRGGNKVSINRNLKDAKVGNNDVDDSIN